MKQFFMFTKEDCYEIDINFFSASLLLCNIWHKMCQALNVQSCINFDKIYVNNQIEQLEENDFNRFIKQYR